MSTSFLVLLFAGAVGGLVRGIVGFLKYQFTYKNVKFNPQYILVIMVLSSIVGFFVTWAVVESGLKVTPLEEINSAIAFIIGYAGGDFIENIYKILVGKTTLFDISKK